MSDLTFGPSFKVGFTSFGEFTFRKSCLVFSTGRTGLLQHSLCGASYFLSGQRNFPASFSFGLCTVQTDF